MTTLVLSLVRTFVKVREIHGLGSVVTALSVVVGASSHIGLIAASAVAAVGQIIAPWVAWWRAFLCGNARAWIVSKLLLELIEFNVDVDCRVDKVIKGIGAGAGAHQFFLDSRLQALTEHSGQRSVVLVSVGGKLLELCGVVGS